MFPPLGRWLCRSTSCPNGTRVLPNVRERTFAIYSAHARNNVHFGVHHFARMPTTGALCFTAWPCPIDADAVVRLLGIASRVVRIFAVYDGQEDSPLGSTGTVAFGSGLALGDRILSAAHISADTDAPGSGMQRRLRGVYAQYRLSSPYIPGLPIADYCARLLPDHETQAAVDSAASGTETVDLAGHPWPHGSDVRVWRIGQRGSFTIDRGESPRPDPVPEWFAAASEARLSNTEHWLLGFPSALDTPELDTAAALWYDGPHLMEGWRLYKTVLGFQQLLASRAKRMQLLGRRIESKPVPAVTVDEGALTARSLDAIKPTDSSAVTRISLLPHNANSLPGMSGGPVLDHQGLIVGLHAAGRSHRDGYCSYVGVDHPALRTAIELVCKRHGEREEAIRRHIAIHGSAPWPDVEPA